MSAEDLDKLDMNESAADELEGNMYGFVDSKTSKANQKPRKITLKLILDRNLNEESRSILKSEYERKFNVNQKQLTNSLDTDEEPEEDDEETKTADKAEKKAMQLLKLTHIHLDREQICEIDNLAEYLGDVTNLYLQGNLIRRIENLEFLHKLKFLILSNNQIERIENLNALKQLKLLDLSYNLIDRVDVQELPKHLAFLDLRHNPCLLGDGETKAIADYLKDLKQLNGDDLFDNEDNDDENNDKEEITEKKDETSIMPDTFKLLSERIIERSKQRQIVDATRLDEISKERRIQMDAARQSIDLNLKNVAVNRT